MLGTNLGTTQDVCFPHCPEEHRLAMQMQKAPS